MANINWGVIITILIGTLTLACCANMNVDDSHEVARNGIGSRRHTRSITHFHDSMSRTKQAITDRKGKKHRRSSKIRVLPADPMLRQRYYPENVEQALGQSTIQRRLKRDPNAAPVELNSAVPKAVEDAENLQEARVHDLEEIYQILARRDGQLLEQMASLKTSMEQLYGIFEFIGVAKMSPEKRDQAIKKILERSANIETSKKAMRV